MSGLSTWDSPCMGRGCAIASLLSCKALLSFEITSRCCCAQDVLQLMVLHPDLEDRLVAQLEDAASGITDAQWEFMQGLSAQQQKVLFGRPSSSLSRSSALPRSASDAMARSSMTTSARLLKKSANIKENPAAGGGGGLFRSPSARTLGLERTSTGLDRGNLSVGSRRRLTDPSGAGWHGRSVSDIPLVTDTLVEGQIS